jgi:CheY-like chemotaxis protein
LASELPGKDLRADADREYGDFTRAMKKILVIDDEENLLMMMVETLQILGFDALSAPDGARGIEMAIAQQPDLILCDLNMPAVDGLETLRTIRGTESTTHTPFVLLSGLADQATRQQAAKLGANDVMTKPFSTSELLSVLNLRLAKAA